MRKPIIENTDNPLEEWRTVVGFPDYFVSNFGRVRSCGRKVKIPRSDGTVGEFWKPEAILKATLYQGYPRVSLRRDGKTTYCMVHRLVACAFIGPCPEGQEVRHKDGTRDNASLSNLEYGTRAQNIDDAKRHGTFPVLEDRPGAKITREVARLIAASPDSNAVLAVRHGISKPTVWAIKTGLTWASVTRDIERPTRSNKGAKWYLSRGLPVPARFQESMAGRGANEGPVVEDKPDKAG